MVGRPKWLETPAPVHTLDVYRVRHGVSHHFCGAPETCWFVMEHRDGEVRIYARLLGVEAETQAEGLARTMNEKEAA